MKTRRTNLARKLIFIYGAIFALILTIAGLTKGFNKANLITTLVFLPVSLYFIAQIIKKISYRFNSKTKPFNLKSFFTQNDPTLFVSLGLFILIIILTIFRSKT